MTIAIICIAFITVIAIRFIWEAELERAEAEAAWELCQKFSEQNHDISEELAKYKRPRGKNGRFV